MYSPTILVVIMWSVVPLWLQGMIKPYAMSENRWANLTVKIMRVWYCNWDYLVIECHSIAPSPIKWSQTLVSPADDCNATLDSRMDNRRIWIPGWDVTWACLWENWSNGSITAVPALVNAYEEFKHPFNNSDKGFIKINGSINLIKAKK